MANDKGPLSGIRVADFSTHAAGPFAGLMLAEMGAQVIKVESSARLDITRRPHPMYGKPAPSFEQVNANKMSATLNLKQPRAIELALELAKVSDLVLQSFRPGVFDRLGFGYEALHNAKPDIILVSLSSNGQSGPEYNYAGYAPVFAAIGGLGNLTGYPDGPPVELRHGMDHTGGMLLAFSAVAALCAKRRTELGQHVDVSVRDLGSSFIGQALMDFAMNGRETQRQGNRDDSAAPQGVYRCSGKDEWVSISVKSQTEWEGLVDAMGTPEWAEGDRFGDAFRRWKEHDALDAFITEWTGKLSPMEVTEKLQSRCVPAFPSLSPSQLKSDRHLEARDAFPTIVHAAKGEMRAVVPPWRFSKTPSSIDTWTPDLGEHNMDVFHGILGLSKDEVESLQDSQVIW